MTPYGVTMMLANMKIIFPLISIAIIPKVLILLYPVHFETFSDLLKFVCGTKMSMIEINCYISATVNM